MHPAPQEPQGLTPAESEFASALASLLPAPAPINPLDLAFRAGQRRERADATRRLRLWQGFAAAASLALAASLLLQFPLAPTDTAPATAPQFASSTQPPAPHSHIPVTTAADAPEFASATSAPLLFVPSAASTRTLPAAPTSLVQRLFSIGLQP